MPVMERFVPKQAMTARYEVSPLCGSHLWRRSQIPAARRRYDIRVHCVKQVTLARSDRGESQTAGRCRRWSASPRESSEITAVDDARSEAAARLQASRRELQRLSPEAVDLDRQRLDRSIASLQAAKTDAETTRTLARARLEREGTTDLCEDLARAAARRRLAAAE